MKEPSTRPLDEPIECDPYRPPSPIRIATAEGASTSSIVDQRQDNSVNKHGPYFFTLAILATLALCTAFYAMRECNLMERETRIMQDDLKYIRAYLSARGIDIPANHDEAESK